MDIYLFSQILKFTLYSIKLIEKLSRRHLINSSDVFFIKGFTVQKENMFIMEMEVISEELSFCHKLKFSCNLNSVNLGYLKDYLTQIRAENFRMGYP